MTTESIRLPTPDILVNGVPVTGLSDSGQSVQWGNIVDSEARIGADGVQLYTNQPTPGVDLTLSVYPGSSLAAIVVNNFNRIRRGGWRITLDYDADEGDIDLTETSPLSRDESDVIVFKNELTNATLRTYPGGVPYGVNATGEMQFTFRGTAESNYSNWQAPTLVV